MSYTISTTSRGDPSAAQDRPTVAGWTRALPLETRLALAVALSVALVISLVTLFGLSIGARRLGDDLRDTARVTALAVSDDFELRPDAPRDAIASTLHEFRSASPSLQSITVFQTGPRGELSLHASTSSAPTLPPELLWRALKSSGPVWQDRTPQLATVAVPAVRGTTPVGVVAVTVSLAAVERFRRAVRLMAVGGTAVAIAGITLLIHLFTRRLVLAPLQEIRASILRVGAGEMGARARVAARDELGEVAAGLNHMLEELEDLHRRLNERVERATEELRQRNEQLVRSYESVLTLRDAAARAQQLAAVGQTMANVAHQIGTPLNLVSGHVQLLRQESADPVLHRRLRIIEEQVERVTTSVRQLLDRAKPQSERSPVDVGAMLDRLVGAMRPRLAASGVTIETALQGDMPAITADETQLELALLNVVTNAADAMPHGGTLTIRARTNDAGVHVDIADTGGGIAPDILPRIFEPWLTTKPGGRGAGLGLSITRDVVSSLGGTISVHSIPDRGTTFTITLPVPVGGIQQS